MFGNDGWQGTRNNSQHSNMVWSPQATNSTGGFSGPPIYFGGQQGPMIAPRQQQAAPNYFQAHGPHSSQKFPGVGLGLPSVVQPHHLPSVQAQPAAAPMNCTRVATLFSTTGSLDRATPVTEMEAASQPMLESLMVSIMMNQEKTLCQNEELKWQGEEVQKWLTSLEQQTTGNDDENTAKNTRPTKKSTKGRRNVAEEPGVEDLGKKALELSVEAQGLRKYLQTEVTNQFHAVTSVSVGAVWPDPNEIRINPMTNEQYLMLMFKEQVTHHVNKNFFKAVAQNDPNNSMPGLHDAKFKWSGKTLEEFAKDTFCNLKPSWKAQFNEANAKKKHGYQQNNRMAMLRTEGDPSELLCPDHMSNEDSGAEDDNESFDDWKGQIAGFAGILGSSEMLDQVKVFEVIKPKWHSDELTAVFHKFQQLWWDSLTAKQKSLFML
ncbi:hypothetical protein C0995_013576 [Termitomyces sp. Mi166|nr:hypothetical protein C0995_013576 [Termitomyces sp. Mi166\